MDIAMVEPVVQAVVEDCRLHLSGITEIKGFIAVDEAADEILAIINPTKGESNG